MGSGVQCYFQTCFEKQCYTTSSSSGSWHMEQLVALQGQLMSSHFIFVISGQPGFCDASNIEIVFTKVVEDSGCLVLALMRQWNFSALIACMVH